MKRLRLHRQGLFRRQPAVCLVRAEVSERNARSLRAQQLSREGFKFLALLVLSSVGAFGTLVAIIGGEPGLAVRILSGTVLTLVTLLLL